MKLAGRAKELGLKGVRATGEDDLALDADAFAAVAKELFATHPLRVVRLWKATGEALVAALATPELARAKELHLTRNRLTDADVEALVHSPHVGGIAKLELGFCGLSGRTGSALARADPRRFPALRDLSLFANKLGAVGVRALAESKLVAQLTDLDLEANHGGDEAIALLLASPAMLNMERIVITRNEADPLAKTALEGSAHALRVTTLTGLSGPRVERILERNAGAKIPWRAPAAPTTPLAKAPEKRAPAPRDDDACGPELVAKLAARPGDPEILGVYADWLQERGDMRGELIALSLKLREKRDPKLAAKVKSLTSKVTKDFQTRFKNKSTRLEFRDGVVVAATGQLRWVLEHGAAILAREPVERFTIDSLSAGGMPKLADVAGFERVSRIDLWNAKPELAAAIRWDKLPKLTLALSLRGREVAAYLDVPSVRERLRSLTIHLWTPEAIRALLATPLALEQLRINQLTADWKEQLEAHFKLAVDARELIISVRALGRDE